MNLRQITDYLQTRSALGGLAFLALAGLAGLVSVYRRPSREISISHQEPKLSLPHHGPILESLKDDVLKPISAIADAPKSLSSNSQRNGDNIPLSIGRDKLAALGNLLLRERTVSDEFAPYGRFIEGSLRTTIVSSSIDTPVVIVVTRPLYFRGKLIVPAGSTIHGTAAKGREQNRVYVQPKVLVNEFTGEEMPIQGEVLTRDVKVLEDGSKTWGLYDATPGVIGELIKSDNMAEVKLFAATFASAFLQAQQTTFQSPLTGQSIPQTTAQNSAYAATAAVINRYADQIMESIRKEGYFLLVPSGRDVWVYIEQTLDAQDYTVGSTRVSERKKGN